MISSRTRQAFVAGIFYPERADALITAIDQYTNQAKPSPIAGDIVALISPHAGYQYSGFTAAHGFALLHPGMFDTVVIVSPSHREYFDGISVFDGDAYRTPLGVINVDESLREDLLQDETIIARSSAGHGKEHALEVQLPFLQRALGTFKLLPIVMGDQHREYCFHLGQKLSLILRGKRALLIASTDLSHYHRYEIAEQMDSVVIHDISTFDYEQLLENLDCNRTEACGGGPTVAVLLAARTLGANAMKILHHCNSGDVTGDRESVVGYLSAVALRTN